ncbi:MAG: tyrosine-type recombinase/integrase [Hydrogenophaga sp.]|nr:tyrosine-type recombinase/integrase [Hydrogenophaga sp.]
MGRTTPGVYPDPSKPGYWQVDKWFKGHRFRQRGFESADEAQGWLIGEISKKRTELLHGTRPARNFDEAAAHYLLTHQTKASIATEIHLLKSVMPHIGTLALHQIHDSTLAPYVNARLAAGLAHKTINLALGVVRRILNLAATCWRDEVTGKTWLEQAPKITLLPLVGHQRPPRPITWSEQRTLMPALPAHLERMALFVLNTGARDDVVCNLQWAWEIKVPELGVSVFDVPPEHVKGGRRSRVIVCNSVAQSVVESCRGMHTTHVFAYRRERVKKMDEQPEMPYRPIQTMNNNGWQSARKAAGLGDLHVHDLRHTVGMRLRESGVPEGSIADVLWHVTTTMTRHYSVAQIVELHAALEKIRDDSGRWNRSLAMLKREQEEARGLNPPKVPEQRKAA